MKLVFATNNPNKLKEVQLLLPEDIKLLSLQDINCFEDIPETSPTIKGNAIQKANYVKTHYGYDCFADDTGLEVDALDGAPGVYSARYAGDQRDDHANMQKVLSELRDTDDRKAHFKTVIALLIDDSLHQFTGVCKGEITKILKGTNGFGYDPIFQPAGYQETFAELSLSTKNKISHRGKAVSQLVHFLKINF